MPLFIHVGQIAPVLVFSDKKIPNPLAVSIADESRGHISMLPNLTIGKKNNCSFPCLTNDESVLRWKIIEGHFQIQRSGAFPCTT